MNAFDPYFVSRLILALLFSGFILYDLIGAVVWYRQLPTFAQKLILLKLLQLRSPAIKRACVLIFSLLSIQGVLTVVLLRGEN